MMNRRAFLKSILALGATAALPRGNGKRFAVTTDRAQELHAIASDVDMRAREIFTVLQEADGLRFGEHVVITKHTHDLA